MIEHLSEKGLARRWGLSARTLQRWRWAGRGPVYLKLGGRVVYRLVDVETWEQAQSRAGRSQNKGTGA
jgi:predicted site-specific integrase-resolvase